MKRITLGNATLEETNRLKTPPLAQVMAGGAGGGTATAPAPVRRAAPSEFNATGTLGKVPPAQQYKRAMPAAPALSVAPARPSFPMQGAAQADAQDLGAISPFSLPARMAGQPNASAGVARAATVPVRGETLAGQAGRITRGVGAAIAAPIEGLARMAVAGAQEGVAGLGNFGRGLVGSPAAEAAPTGASGNPDPAVAALAQPPASTVGPPAQAAAPTPPVGPPAPIGRMTDKQIWDTRAQGRVVDGVETFDAQWAADPNNQRRIDLYAGNGNTVASVVPPPGVAQGMISGTTPAAIARAPAGFTQADRLQQLDGLDRLGRSVAEGQQRDAASVAITRAGAAATRGDFQRSAALNEVAQTATAAAGGLAQPPRVEPMRRADPNDAARVAIEQQRANQEGETAGVQNQGAQLQLQQAQQMQTLTTQLLQGSPEQKTAAAASLAALQRSKPGQPIKVKRQFDTGKVDFNKDPVMGEEEVVYDPRTRGFIEPPQRTQAGGPPPFAVEFLRQNDSPEMREKFKAKYGVDPAQLLG